MARLQKRFYNHLVHEAYSIKNKKKKKVQHRNIDKAATLHSVRKAQKQRQRWHHDNLLHDAYSKKKRHKTPAQHITDNQQQQ
jgi:hypothetical protein